MDLEALLGLLYLSYKRLSGRRLIALSGNDALSNDHVTGLELGFAPYEKRITELLKVAKLTRITILIPTGRFFDPIIDVDY